MCTRTSDISQHSTSKLRLSHGAKRSQHHAKALPYDATEHEQITVLPTPCARYSAEPPEPIHHAKALHELRSEQCAMHRGTHMRSRNHDLEVALACACDRWHRWVSRVHESSSSRQTRAPPLAGWAVRPGSRQAAACHHIHHDGAWCYYLLSTRN